jgi:transketolase
LSGQSPKRVIRLGLQDRWGESAPNEYLLNLFELSPAPLCARVKTIVQPAA